MTLAELRQALRNAVATNKIGTPVSLRISLQLADSASDVNAVVASLATLAEELFASPTAGVFARRSSASKQLNVLIDYKNGRTCMLTAGAGSTAAATMHLLLVGNHGVAQLAGGDVFDEACLLDRQPSATLSEFVAQSLAQNRAVTTA